jgi:hypothetical protein
MWAVGDGRLTDGEYYYDQDGRDLGGRPKVWIDGLPGEDDNDEGGGGGSGGALTSSPYYRQYASQLEATRAADLSNTKSMLQQLLIQFGMVPEGFQDKYGALDDTIRALIQKNTDTGISGYARLKEARGLDTKSSLSNLARRGLMRSGAKGAVLRQSSLNNDRNLADALAAILGNANGLQSGFAGRDMERQNALAQFLTQLSSQYTPRGGSPYSTPPRPQLSEPQAPVYQSAAGPSPYEPTSTGGTSGQDPGYYTGGALYATPTENPKINPNFWLK